MIDKFTKNSVVNLYKNLGYNGIIGFKREILILNSFKNSKNNPLFCMNSVYNWLKNCVNKKRKYTNYKITDEIEKFVIDSVKKNVSIKSPKLKKLINEKFKIDLSKPSIYCILKKNNLTHKKLKINVNRYSKEKQIEQIKIVNDKVIIAKSIENEEIISIDEMSIHLNEKDGYGWSEKGKPCIYIDTKGKVSNERFSLLMAVSNKQVIAHTLVNNSIDSNIFLDFMTHIKNKNRTFFLDNCSIHHSKIFKAYVETEKIKLIYNAPYHSEFNPIEHVFSMIRREVKENENHTLDNIKKIINNFSKVNNCTKFTNIFNHCFKQLQEYN